MWTEFDAKWLDNFQSKLENAILKFLSRSSSILCCIQKQQIILIFFAQSAIGSALFFVKEH